MIWWRIINDDIRINDINDVMVGRDDVAPLSSTLFTVL